MTSEGEQVVPGGRVIGLDVGDRRIGVSISDPDQRIAVPLPTIERDRHGGEIEAIRRLVEAEEVKAIIVGLPLSLSGEDSAQTESTRQFARRLEEALARPVRLWDERLSSLEASRMAAPPPKGGRRDRGKRAQPDIDAMAATIILQSYLDSRRFA
jgi:putative holliday junction resolvase